MGTLLLAPLGSASLEGLGYLDLTIFGQLKVQIIGSISVAVWAGVAFIILMTLKRFIGIRVSEEEEEAGPDVSSHSESYN